MSGLTKVGRVEITLDIVELRVIKDIEELRTEFENLSLSDLRCLVKREVPVVDARAVEEATIGVSGSTQGLR